MLPLRIVWGAALLLRGGAGARLLGARQLAQAALLRSHPRAGAAIDATHALSMLALAALSPRWRRRAIISAAVAATFTAMGLMGDS